MAQSLNSKVDLTTLKNGKIEYETINEEQINYLLENRKMSRK